MIKIYDIFEEGDELFFESEKETEEEALWDYFFSQKEEEDSLWESDPVRIVDHEGKESFYEFGCKLVQHFGLKS